ncbi:MAG: outer membrane protein transport protein [Gammaproteobacteria bacterium]|nr:outer membrane protein transport protein [Gammaproteobacteria bacterium]
MVQTGNPAGLVDIGDRQDIGLTWFSPRREYTVSGAFNPRFPPFPGDTVESGSESFLIPNFGFARQLDDDAAFGIALYGNGGMNTDYSASDTVLPTPRARARSVRSAAATPASTTSSSSSVRATPGACRNRSRSECPASSTTRGWT